MIQLRRATPDDAASIAAIELDNYHRVYRGHVPDDWLDRQTLPVYVPWWRERLSAPQGDAEVLLALDAESRVLGFGRSGGDRHGPRDGAGEFQKLYVAHGAQRAGVGRLLMAGMAQRLHNLNYRHARVWVLTSNQPARRFYERLGGLHVDFTHDETLDDGHVLRHVGYCWRDLEELYKLILS